MTVHEFNMLASGRLKFKVCIKNVHKICDFRPSYGVIFEKYLHGYEFWGYTDIDVLWGDIRSFITDDLLEHYQVISAHKLYLCGHFTLFKNQDYINNMFKLYSDFEKMASGIRTCTGFDEGGISKISQSLAKEQKIKLFCEEFLVLPGTIARSYWKDLSDQAFKQVKVGDGYWKEGKIFHTASGKERMYLHFHTWKLNWKFYSNIIAPRKINRIDVTKNGFKISCDSGDIFATRDIRFIEFARKVIRYIINLVFLNTISCKNRSRMKG